MATDVKLARAALKASGLHGCATTLSLLFPLGREGRLQAVLRRRHSVLEAKNNILDTLFRRQKPLEPLALRSLDQVTRALADPGKRRLLLTLGLSRGVLEDEARKWGTELGPAFDQALLELVTDGRLIKSPSPSGSDIYVIVAPLARQRYDLSLLSRLLQRGKAFGSQLRLREREADDTAVGRTYRM